MAQIMKFQQVKCPKPVYIATVGDFPSFEEALKTLCQKYLSPDWEWTLKVGGKVQKEIEKVEPNNEGIAIINKRTQQFNFNNNDNKHDNNNNIFQTPLKPELKQDNPSILSLSPGKSPKVAPPPPSPTPTRPGRNFKRSCGGNGQKALAG